MNKILIVIIMVMVLPVAGAVETEHELDRSLPSEDILLTMIVVDIALMLYVYSKDIDSDTYYTTITVGVFVAVLSLAISTMLIGGYITSVAITINESVGTYTYDVYTIINHSAGVGLLFVLVAIMMLMHVVMVVIDMFRDLQNEDTGIELN